MHDRIETTDRLPEPVNTEIPKYRNNGIGFSPQNPLRRALTEEMVEQLLPGLSRSYTPLSHMSRMKSVLANLASQVVGKRQRVSGCHAHGCVMEPHIAHAGYLDTGRI